MLQNNIKNLPESHYLPSEIEYEYYITSTTFKFLFNP